MFAFDTVGPLRLSPFTSMMYSLSLIFIPFFAMGVPVATGLGLQQKWTRLMVIIVIFTFLTLLSSLLADFTGKLKQIQRNKTLNAFIRRQIICSVLTVMTIITALLITAVRMHRGFAEYDSPGNEWFVLAEVVWIPLHILCNFLCVALSYRCCDSLIVFLCGCVRCCRVIPITTEDQDAIFLEQIMKNSKPPQIEHEAPSTRTLPATCCGSINDLPAATPPPTMNIAGTVRPVITPPPPLTMAGAVVTTMTPPPAAINPVQIGAAATANAGHTTLSATTAAALPGMPQNGHYSRNLSPMPNIPQFQIVYEY